MEFRHVPIDQLKPAPYNPRADLHADDEAWQRLAASIERFDCVEPIVWNERTGHVVGGHQRLKVLTARGQSEAPCTVVDLDEADERVLNLALNRIAGRWDGEKLGELIRELAEVPELDLEPTGFTEAELDDLKRLAEVPELDLSPAEPDHAEVVELRFGSSLYLLPKPLADRLRRLAQTIRHETRSDDLVTNLTVVVERLEGEAQHDGRSGRGE